MELEASGLLSSFRGCCCLKMPAHKPLPAQPSIADRTFQFRLNFGLLHQHKSDIRTKLIRLSSPGSGKPMSFVA